MSHPLYAIDPGTEQSAVVQLDASGGVDGRMWDNRDLVIAFRGTKWFLTGHLVIEQIESFGMPVGVETFETVFWSGRFAEAWDTRGGTWSRIGRKAVKLALCGTAKAKDPHIRQALIDRYGGSACVKKGGALAGIKSHCWAALAVAVAYQDTHTQAAAMLQSAGGGQS
jgi:hypothetical protein